MQHYIVSTSRRKHQPVLVPCGAPHCTALVPVSEGYRLRVPDEGGAGILTFDARPKTPTGGRLGMPGALGRRRFLRTKLVWGCVGCSLKFPVIERPRDARFAERCKSGRGKR